MATIRQQQVAQKILENPRTSMRQAMRDAGYSPAYYNHPAELLNTKSFQDVMESTGITLEKLAQRLYEGLDASKVIFTDKPGDSAAVSVQPDYAVRHKYLETGLRLLGYGKGGFTASGLDLQRESVIIYRPAKIQELERERNLQNAQHDKEKYGI